MADSVIYRTSPPPWSVIGFTCSHGNTDSELTIMCQMKRFAIHSTAANFDDSPQLKETYLTFLEVAQNFKIDGPIAEDFYDWAIKPLLPTFKSIPLIEEGHWFLDEYLYPETLVYTLRAEAGELVAVPLESSPRRRICSRFGVTLPQETCSPWPWFAPFELQICRWRHPRIGLSPYPTPTKVSLRDGTVAFVKLASRGDRDVLIRELDSYTKIDTAPLSNTLMIPRLKGLVRDGSDLVHGLLLTYIDCGGLTLACAAAKSDTPSCLREKWAMQVQQTVWQLHFAGIVWGDAKPDSVLIDKNQDAWVVDFGGGYTAGWVPRELAETLEGDLLALNMMPAFIGVGPQQSSGNRLTE